MDDCSHDGLLRYGVIRYATKDYRVIEVACPLCECHGTVIEQWDEELDCFELVDEAWGTETTITADRPETETHAE